MDLKAAKKRLEELRKIINYHNKNYYDLDSPTISDYEYDMLYRELESLEYSFPKLKTLDSPTNKIGGVAKKELKQVKHVVPMESLHDCFSIEEIKDFDKKLRETIKSPEYAVEPKIDGLSVSIEYKNGVLFRASTRGDGLVGEDITDNIRAIKSVPKILSENIEFIELRGEVFMSTSNFKKLIKEQELNEEKLFKNPRNAAAGSLRQKDPSVTAKRNLDIFIFNIQQIKGKGLKTHVEALNFTKSLGLPVVPFYNVYKNMDKIISEIKRIGDQRESFDFPIDGAVIKINNFEDRKTLGSTSKFPKWAQAFKYPPEEKQTKLLDIEINVGRTGTLTPTGVLEPVLLAGTTVSRATLHNQDYIKQRDIRIGDTVLVYKAGEIIPEIIKSIKHQENSKEYKLPQVCPSCGAKVKKEPELAAIKCVNSKCPSQILRKLIHFVSRDAMDIDGMGQALLAQLTNKNILTSFADIYTLKKQTLSSLERMGEKSAQNIINSIENSKNKELYNLIYALGIEHIGLAAAKLLAKKFKTLNNIINANLQEIAQIEGFGKVMAQSIVDFFSIEENLNLVNKLQTLGVVNNAELQENISQKLEGLTFVLTGTLPNLKRSQASKLIEENGGKVSSSVSKKTSFVLAGEDAGSKLEKAKNLNIKVINESEFLKMVD